jgi:ribosomal protein L44E
MTNYDSIAPGSEMIEDRTDQLKILVVGAAEDIKKCANVCDAYSKKTDMAKLILSSVWDTRLLNWTNCFIKWRKNFESELIMGTREGVDKANLTLDDMSKQLGCLYFCPRCALTTDHRMNEMKALLQEFVSPGQKQILEVLAKIGGVEGLRKDENLKALIKVEKSVTKSSSQPVEERRMGPAKRRDETLELENLRNDIFEEPHDAIDNNWTVFNRKFETQKNQIDDLTRVVRQESDRIVREVQGSAHERIIDEVSFQVLAYRLAR